MSGNLSPFFDIFGLIWPLIWPNFSYKTHKSDSSVTLEKNYFQMNDFMAKILIMIEKVVAGCLSEKIFFPQVFRR